jgi:nucleoside 2-deoxyribosyltransferase
VKKLYFAAPLFTPNERSLNERIVGRLETKFQVFLPQRDGILLPGASLSHDEYSAVSREVFKVDVLAIDDCAVLFAVLDGRTVDEGVAFELGVAHALGKRCIGFRTDARVLLTHGINPMIAQSCDIILPSDHSMEDWLEAEVA